jgi:hypothetical protein
VDGETAVGVVRCSGGSTARGWLELYDEGEGITKGEPRVSGPADSWPFHVDRGEAEGGSFNPGSVGGDAVAENGDEDEVVVGEAVCS